MARYIMGNMVYDTEKSTKEAEGYLMEPLMLVPSFRARVEAELWKTTKGNWFFVLTGDYNKGRIATEKDAMDFLKSHDYDQYVVHFGELDEA